MANALETSLERKEICIAQDDLRKTSSPHHTTPDRTDQPPARVPHYLTNYPLYVCRLREHVEFMVQHLVTVKDPTTGETASCYNKREPVLIVLPHLGIRHLIEVEPQG